MLKHTDSVDSTYRLRTNPLNIRNHDGTDLILSKVDKLGQMADTRRPVSQIYPDSRQPSLQVCPERYEHDSDNDSISEESAFATKMKDFHEKLNYNFSHPYQQQQQPSKYYQDYMRPESQKTRPLSYPNYSSYGNMISSDFVLPPPPQPQSSHHSRSSSHESLSNALSKEISRDRAEQVKEGIDIVAIKARQIQEKAKLKVNSKPTCQPHYIEIDSPAVENSLNHSLLPVPSPSVQKKTISSYQKSPEDHHLYQTEVEDKLPTPEVPKKVPDCNSFQLELSLASPDLSSLMSEFSQISFQQSQQTTSLGRKNTITSPNSSIKTSPSKTAPAVFERMRSLRKSQSKENFNTTARQQQQQLLPSPVALKKQPSVETVAVTHRTDFKSTTSRPPPIVTTAKPEIVSGPSVAPVHVPITEYRSLDPDPTRRQAHEAELKRLEEEKEKEKASIQHDCNQFDDAIEEELIENEESEPVIVDGPIVSSPVVSVYSFDAHMIDQLCAIPSPIMNAISFTPPLGSTTEEDEVEETNEVDSIFSKKVDKNNNQDSDSIIESAPEDIPTVSKYHGS